MRLRVLDSGHRLRGRMFFWLMRAVAGTEDAVAKRSLYRPSFFGRALLRFIRSAMRGPSDWSAGERELFAALVSRLNSCPFCVSVHVGITALALNPTITAEQLDHWRDIGLRSQVAATLALGK
jgi:AhpD family alkylhydroperoxidase